MDRSRLISALITEGIRRYFRENPVKDNSEVLEKIQDRLDELSQRLNILSQRPPGETVIELDTKQN